MVRMLICACPNRLASSADFCLVSRRYAPRNAWGVRLNNLRRSAAAHAIRCCRRRTAANDRAALRSAFVQPTGARQRHVDSTYCGTIQWRPRSLVPRDPAVIRGSPADQGSGCPGKSSSRFSRAVSIPVTRYPSVEQGLVACARRRARESSPPRPGFTLQESREAGAGQALNACVLVEAMVYLLNAVVLGTPQVNTTLLVGSPITPASL